MKSILPLLVFFVGAIGVVVLFTVGKTCLGLSADDVSALFTGIGLAGIVATLLHQQLESSEQQNQHSALLASMAKQADAGYRVAEAGCLAAELAVRESQIVNKDPSISRDAAAARRQQIIDRLTQLNPDVK